MNNVTTINPLMQSIQYNGQTYFTGQYFHQMYRNNSETGGKYKRVADFIRLIRSIEAYQEYINAKDIVEIDWAKAQELGNAKIALLLKSNSYKTVMLINATAQVALTHHLDDQVSKNASVNINRGAANDNAITRVLARDMKTAREAICLIREFGEMVGTEPQMINAVAADQVAKITGIDVKMMLAGNHVEDRPLTPSELGKELDVSGQQINKELEKSGFQIKDDNGEWRPTEKGKKFCTVNPYKSARSNHTGYRVLWRKTVLEEMTKVS